MEFLQQILPKDLVNIIEDYYNDPWKEKYNDVILDLNLLIHDIRIFCENTTENFFIDHFILNVFLRQYIVLGKPAIYNEYYVPEFWWEPSHAKTLREEKVLLDA